MKIGTLLTAFRPPTWQPPGPWHLQMLTDPFVILSLSRSSSSQKSPNSQNMMNRAMDLDSEDEYEYEYHDTETEVSYCCLASPLTPACH